MTELQNIALIYESSVLLVEDAQARINYLIDKYRGAFATAITNSESTPGDSNYDSNYLTYQSMARDLFRTVVEVADPTHGKYSEWLVIQLIKSFKTKDTTTADHLWDLLTHKEDCYKIRELFEVYDKIKHKLPTEQRDINRLSYPQLVQLVTPHIAEQEELSKKELARKIKSEESVKLVDGLEGWTVIIPLTKQAARFYGAGTKWCTSARNDEDNMFDSYTKRGYLYMFMKGNEKFQWWAATDAYSDAKDEYKEWEKAGGHEMTHDEEGYWEEGIGDQSYLTDSEVVQFMDELDHPVRTIKVIPPEVWKATFQAPFTKGDAVKFKDSQASLADWWYETS